MSTHEPASASAHPEVPANSNAVQAPVGNTTAPVVVVMQPSAASLHPPGITSTPPKHRDYRAILEKSLPWLLATLTAAIAVGTFYAIRTFDDEVDRKVRALVDRASFQADLVKKLSEDSAAKSLLAAQVSESVRQQISLPAFSPTLSSAVGAALNENVMGQAERQVVDALQAALKNQRLRELMVSTLLADSLLVNEMAANIARDPRVRGERGEPGVKGDQGEKGEKGERGDRGETGLKGEPGVAGQKGEKGETGAPGRDGQRGEKGPPGEKGEKGDPGQQGDPGQKGEQDEPG